MISVFRIIGAGHNLRAKKVRVNLFLKSNVQYFAREILIVLLVFEFSLTTDSHAHFSAIGFRGIECSICASFVDITSNCMQVQCNNYLT